MKSKSKSKSKSELKRLAVLKAARAKHKPVKVEVTVDGAPFTPVELTTVRGSDGTIGAVAVTATPSRSPYTRPVSF